MINEFLRRDTLFASLIRNSNLTKVQMDTLLSYWNLKQNDGSLSEMIRMRDKVVTKGSFLHTLNQAKQNVRASVYSILLLGYIGLLNKESIEGLVRVTTLLNDLKKTGGNSKSEEIVFLIEGLCDRLISV